MQALMLILLLNFPTVSLIEKVRAVEDVFRSLDEAVAEFQKRSTLRCITGCGKCCLKPDIEASVLEFLPLAFHLYEQKTAERWLETLNTREEKICSMIEPQRSGGLCTQYLHRGLICRLFGFSARINKHAIKELITCAVIKTEQHQQFEAASRDIARGGTAPVVSHYYMSLYAIDPLLARDFYPINQAIRKALEAVLHHYAYQEE